MRWTYIVIGLLSGVVLPLQAAINAQLRSAVASAPVAAFISFAVGAISLLAYAAFVRIAWPDPRLVGQAPWWVWLGGVLGALYVLSAIVVTPRLGASALVAVTVAGQLIAALVMDHYGWLGLPAQPLGVERILGAMLLMGGVLLMTRG